MPSPWYLRSKILIDKCIICQSLFIIVINIPCIIVYHCLSLCSTYHLSWSIIVINIPFIIVYHCDTCIMYRCSSLKPMTRNPWVFTSLENESKLFSRAAQKPGRPAGFVVGSPLPRRGGETSCSWSGGFHGGTPWGRWMICNGNSYFSMDDDWGYPLFGKPPHMFIFCLYSIKNIPLLDYWNIFQ